MQKKIYLLSAFMLGCVFSLLAQVSVILPSQDITCGEMLTIPLTVSGFTDVDGIQFSLQWNPSEISFNAATTVSNDLPTIAYNSMNTAGGSLGVTWFDPLAAGIDLVDGTTIIELSFQVVGNSFGAANINFTNAPTAISASVNLSETPLDVTSFSDLNLVDRNNPTLSCPGPQAATTVSGANSVAVLNISPTTSDNCGIDSTSYTLTGATTGIGMDDASGTLFNIGTTTVTYTTKDFVGNADTCAFDVVITAGTAGSSDSVTIQGASLIASCDAAINLPISVTGFQEITDLSFDISWNANQLMYVGIADFALDGLDISNFDVSQTGTGSISLTWDNVIAQTLTDNAVIFNLQFSSMSAVANETVNISNDSAQQNNITFGTGTVNGNITLQDTDLPSITCPANQIASTLPGLLATVVNGLTATATDNCSTPILTYILTGATTGGGAGDASGTTFNIGVTTVTYAATDASGNVNTCSFTVTISGVSPTDYTLFAASQTASCDDNDITVDINVAAFNDILGTQFSVNWDPTILTYVSHDIGVLTNNVLFGTDSVTAGRIGYTWFEAAGTTLADASTLFTLHFTPAGGGTSGISFTNNPVPIAVTNSDFTEKTMSEINLIVGSVAVTDTEAPTITAPANQTITLAMGETSTIVNNLDPITADNCGNTTFTYTLSGATTGTGNGSASGQSFNAGTTTITYTVTDGGGNTQTASSTVTLEAPGAMQVNVVAPIAECGGGPFKVDITVDDFTNGAGIQFSVDWAEAVLQFDSIGSSFGLPLNLISDFRLDQTTSGQLGFAWFNATGNGIDLVDGTILFSIYYTILGQNGATSDILIIDDPVIKEGSVFSGVVPSAVPLIGNSSSVIIVDNTPPVVMNPFAEMTTIYVAADACTAIGTWTAPTFSDACSNNLSLIRSHDPGTNFDVGQYVIKYTATDPSGNAVSDSTNLIVRDTTNPILINCPPDITLTGDANCQAIATWTAPTATDNCQLATISSTHSSGDTLVETTTVTYTAEDVYGNRSTCSFVITVDGVVPVVFNSFPGDIIVNAAQGQCGANIGWVIPTASGGCDNTGTTITIASSAQPGDFFPVGVNTIEYTATDEAGQSISNSFTITVIDNQDIVVICPTDIEIQADGTVLMDGGNFINTVVTDTCGEYVITFNDIQAFDNCSPISTMQTQGLASGSTFPFGSTMMEFILSDTMGNSRTCTFQITINETRALQASTLDNPTCAGADLRLTVDTLIGGVYQWNGPGGFLANVQNPVIPNAMTQNSGEYIVKVIAQNGCSIKDSVMVGILSGPEVEAMGNDLNCSAELDTIRLFATVTNGIPIQSYSWTGPGGFMTDFQNPIILNATNSNVGQYIVTGTSSNGCADSDTVTVNISGMVMPTITSGATSDTVCANSPITLTGTAYDGIVNYVWTAPAEAGLPNVIDTNEIIVTPTTAGTYTYSFYANLDGGCTSDTARISFVVENGAGTITLGSNGPFDCVAENQTIDLTATGGVDIAIYTWTGPNSFTSSEQNPSIPVSNAASGNYTLVARSNDGCIATNNIDIAITVQSGPPEIFISSGGSNTSTNICEGDALTLTGEDILNATYSWVGPNSFSSTDRVVSITNFMSDNAGAYQLRVEVDGCFSAPSTVGPLNALADITANNDDFSVVRSTPLTFSVIENDVFTQGAAFNITLMNNPSVGTIVNNNDGTFTYSNTIGQSEDLAYEICYEDCPNLCDMATISLMVGLDPGVCHVPSFISPNNDGFNDALVISCVPDVPKVGSELIVYNEWGSEVFRESPYQNNWMGTYNGKDLPDGTYYYVFKEDNDDPDPKKGYVTIFR